MEEVVSLIVANGLWAVLFCGLLVFMLRDGKAREEKYTQTILSLADRLDTVIAVKADTEEIKTDTGALVKMAGEIVAGQAELKRALAAGKKSKGGEVCAKSPT